MAKTLGVPWLGLARVIKTRMIMAITIKYPRLKCAVPQKVQRKYDSSQCQQQLQQPQQQQQQNPQQQQQEEVNQHQ